MKILVTGATSFLGSHIVEELAKQGLAIRAAYPPDQSFHGVDSDFLIDGLDLETFPLDISNAQQVHEALQGCQILFHTDFLYSLERKDKNRLYQINQIGTRNVMTAALAHGVEKVVYTSGIETLQVPDGQEQGNERDGVTMDDLKTHFEKSRYLAEREIAHLRSKGLPAIIVHPTIAVGIRENATTPFGQYLDRYLKRRTHFYLDTGLNLIDVHDVAKGHLLAAKRGKVGARYILGNQNVYLLEVLQKLNQLTGIAPPKTALPFLWAKIGNGIVRNIFQRRSGIPNSFIKKLQTPLFFDSSLARNELGFPQSNIWEALQRQVAYFLKK